MPSIICTNCGVELEEDMQYCPLCGEMTDSHAQTAKDKQSVLEKESGLLSYKSGRVFLTKKAAWAMVSVILLSIILTTGIINFSINKEISWSVLPIAACLIAFSYVSVFTFMIKRTTVQIWAGFISGSVLLFILDNLTGGRARAVTLGIPLLFFSNLILSAMLNIIHRVKQKGINLIAYGFIAAALLCLFIETILSLSFKEGLRLMWSLIVSACVLPVSALLLFLHYKLKKGRDLIRTFHA